MATAKYILKDINVNGGELSERQRLIAFNNFIKDEGAATFYGRRPSSDE